MAVTLILVRIFLALIFGVAGFAKLVDIAGSKKAFTEFDLPTRWASPLGIFLPVAEVITAIALILAVSAWWGAIGAVTLLLMFIVGISVNLARGRKPDCHCFGQLHSQPIGKSTLIRNTVLLGAASLLVWQGQGSSMPSLFLLGRAFSAIQFMELLMGSSAALLLAVIGWFVLHLSRQNGRLLLRIEALEARLNVPHMEPSPILPQGLSIGMVAPSFELPDLDGNKVTLDGLRDRGKPLLLVFSDPHCGPCKTLLPRLADWQLQHQQKLNFAVISRGSVKENRAKSADDKRFQVLLQKEREVAEAYEVNGTPGAVLILPNGTIGSSAAMGAEAISSLLAQLTGTALPLTQSVDNPDENSWHTGSKNSSMPAFVNIGQSAPAIELPDLSGKAVKLEDFRGQPLLVIFWNPNCGYCQRMLPELKAWKLKRTEDAPRLLVISTGTVEANRALELEAPVLLDASFSVGQAFGTGSTPSAILINAEGRIASDILVGSAEIKKMVMPLQKTHTTIMRL